LEGADLIAYIRWARLGVVVQGGRLPRFVRGTDNVWRAERILQWCEAAGWIVRQAHEPTREQMFFGVGGSSYDVSLRDPRRAAARERVEFAWEISLSAPNPWDAVWDHAVRAAELADPRSRASQIR
jgi:hypothetical protein